MTGRELIIYILENHLEEKEVFDSMTGDILGLMTVEQAALKFGVGWATIRVWINEGSLDAIRLGDVIFIPANSKNPKKSKEN